MVTVNPGFDLLTGKDTDFKNEVLTGQPILLGHIGDSEPDLSLGEYKIEGFQSLKSLLTTEPVLESVDEGSYELYTFGTEIVILGGMDTSAKPDSVRTRRGAFSRDACSGPRRNLTQAEGGFYGFY